MLARLANPSDIKTSCSRGGFGAGRARTQLSAGFARDGRFADYIITGNGEISFALLCRQLFAGVKSEAKIIRGEAASLQDLASPYPYYTDTDLQRIIYVEASRGCPFKCEFCLSSLDTTAKPFDLSMFLQDMDTLYRRGARHFKFIDRTFNLKVDSSVRILEFFLARVRTSCICILK